MGRGFFVEVAVAELGVVTVGVQQRVRAMRLVPLGWGDRLREPSVVLLATQLQDPARERHRDSFGGQLRHEREEPFPGKFA